ncbi:MAG: DUF6624 domain-containing protein [Bacteroidota bacterium]
MKLHLLIIALTLTSMELFGQSNIDKKLKKSLDSIMNIDQKYRYLAEAKAKGRKKRIARKYNVSITNFDKDLMRMQKRYDSTNLIFVENVFSTRGYPGRNLVGDKTCMVAFFVIQHNIDKIGIYLDLMKKAEAEKQLPTKCVPMMEDRYLMNQGKEQIYGTQIYIPKGESKGFVYPIQDPENVNKRRKEAGYKETVEEYAKRFNITYSVVKLNEVPK